MLARMRAAGIRRRIPHGVTNRPDASTHVTAIRFGTDMFRRCDSCPAADRRYAFANDMRLKRDLTLDHIALRSTGLDYVPFRTCGTTFYADGKAVIVDACATKSAAIEQTHEVHQPYQAHQMQTKHKMPTTSGTCSLCPATGTTDDARKASTPRAPSTSPDVMVKSVTATPAPTVAASACPCKANGNCYTQRGPVSMTIITGIILLLALGVLGSIAGMCGYLYRKRAV